MGKIIVTNIENKIFSCVYDDFKLNRISVSDADKESILDRIYVGKVKNIVKNINAAFVEISDGIICYLELREVKNPVFLNEKKNNTITVGDEILVQVTKDVQQSKAPVVTTSFGIKSDNLILTHGKTNIGISNKITDNITKRRINQLFESFINDNYGFIARTSSKEQDNEILLEEINYLIESYNNILNKAKYVTCFSCVYTMPAAFICDIKEMINKNIEEIVIEDDKLYEVASVELKAICDKYNINLRHYDDITLPLTKLYSVEANIADLLKERVWLKSGGNIVIQHTEALTVIDVNTSKSIKIKGNCTDTFLKINKEAAKEIAYQLSLRNIGGIIIIDFIDLKREKDKKELLEYFQTYLNKDYVKADIVDMTKLNLVEVTRKKVKPPLARQVREIMNVFEKYRYK